MRMVMGGHLAKAVHTGMFQRENKERRHKTRQFNWFVSKEETYDIYNLDIKPYYSVIYRDETSDI
jgi:hypothetical protein